MKDSRVYYIDILRIICCFGVVMLHVSAAIWYKAPIGSFNFIVSTFYDTIFRCAVPVFFMISGALMLNKKDLSLKTIYLKNIKKLFIIFVFWVLCYAVYYHYYYGGSITSFQSVIDIIKSVADNQYQLWFLCPLITIYMLLPILKKIVDDNKVLKYFLILFAIFSIGKSSCTLFLSTTKLKFFNLITPDMIAGYHGYALLGYYLYQKDFSSLWKYIIYVFGIISIFLTTYLTVKLSIKYGQIYDRLFGYMFITTAISAIALFVFIKNTFSKKEFSVKSKKYLKMISDCTLGVYIFHVWGIEIFKYIGITGLFINPIIGIPFLSGAIFICSCLLTLLLKKIPIVRKYLV